MGINAFGPIRVEGPTGPDRIPGARERAILAMLVARFGRVVSDDVIVDELWGFDADISSAMRSLRVRISRLRKVLSAVGATIEHVGSGYRLECDADTIDTERFRALVEAAEHAGTASRPGLCEAALGEWVDEPFADFRYVDAFTAPRTDLAALRRRAVVLRSDALVALGKAGEAVHIAQRAVADTPDDESLVRSTMRVLAAAGRPTEALDLFGSLQAHLATRGLDPAPLTRELELAIVTAEPLGPATVTEPSATVPVWDVPIGREAEIDRAMRIVTTQRIVTILGPGGVGKTRVAAAVAAAVAGEFPSGVWWVGLADANDAVDVAGVLAASLGIRLHGSTGLEESIADVVGRGRALVVLDNAEQVASPVADLLGSLVPHLPGLHVLVTSQVALGVAAETRLRLAPLALPRAGATQQAAQASPAVRLFHSAAERAGAAAVDDHASVVRLTRTLDGLPLAIELAAARTTTLAPEEIVARLHDELALLDAPGRPDRNSSVRLAVTWSIGLLDDDARTILGRCSVFAAGFSLEAAESVGTHDGTAAGGAATVIARLVDHSLIEVSTVDNQRRLHLLDAVRRVAADHAVDLTSARLAHARWYASFLVRAGRLDTAEGVAAVNGELHQLRLAFATASELDPALARAMAASSAWYWNRHGDWGMGLSWYDTTIENGLPDEPSAAVAILIGAAPMVLFGEADAERAERLWDRADRIAAEHDMPRPFNGRSLVHSYRGDYDAAISLLQRQVEQDHRLGSSADTALANLAHLHAELGELAAAERFVRLAHTESIRFGSGDITHTDLIDAQIAWQAGRLDEARHLAQDLLRRWVEQGLNLEHQTSILHLLCHIEMDAGHFGRAIEVLDESARGLARITRDLAHHLLLTAALARRAGDSDTAADLTRAALDRLGEDEMLFPTRRTLVGPASAAVPQRTSRELLGWAAETRDRIRPTVIDW